LNCASAREILTDVLNLWRRRMRAELEDLIGVLKEDTEAGYPRYPEQALFALADKRVVSLLEKRLDDGSLVSVESLGHDERTGIHRLLFRFEGAGRLRVQPLSILVLLDPMCKVVGILEEFDPERVNRFAARVPGTVISGALPFTLTHTPPVEPAPSNPPGAAVELRRPLPLPGGGIGFDPPIIEDPGPDCGPPAVKTWCEEQVRTCPPWFGPCGPDILRYGCDCAPAGALASIE
jgi:hypothetical protein